MRSHWNWISFNSKNTDDLDFFFLQWLSGLLSLCFSWVPEDVATHTSPELLYRISLRLQNLENSGKKRGWFCWWQQTPSSENNLVKYGRQGWSQSYARTWIRFYDYIFKTCILLNVRFTLSGCAKGCRSAKTAGALQAQTLHLLRPVPRTVLI